MGRFLASSQIRPLLLSSSSLAGAPRTNPESIIATAAPFSTTAPQCKRKTRDNNRLRGVSALRRTGPREPFSVSWEQLPEPAKYKPPVRTDEDHGLWGFFHGKDKLMNTPAEDGAHGRAWTVQELRQKGWEDLHALWWACCRERNCIATADAERTRAGLGFGEYESSERDVVVSPPSTTVLFEMIGRRVMGALFG